MSEIAHFQKTMQKGRTSMTPERKLEHADNVRRLYQAEKQLDKLEAKVAKGHDNLTMFRDRVADRVRHLGGAA